MHPALAACQSDIDSPGQSALLVMRPYCGDIGLVVLAFGRYFCRQCPTVVRAKGAARNANAVQHSKAEARVNV